VELKIFRGEKTIAEGLEQTADYMDKLGCAEGWLLVFDRDTEKPWDEKTYTRKEAVAGKNITIVGC
jgi:hypothetical protein